MTIYKDYISAENTYTNANQPKYIVVHETDNYAEGADAKRHASAQAAGNLSTSVHYYAGSDGVYQAAAHSDGTYSIGTEYGGNHVIEDADNRNTINIEICVNSDGDYTTARKNAIELVRYLIQTTGIPAERVIRHFDAKGKYCPRKMMDSPELWKDFQDQIGQESSGNVQAAASEETEDSDYTQKQFILDVQKATGSNPDGIAGSETIGNTVTVSRTSNKYHPVVSPLERRLKALNYYEGEIEEDKGEQPCFGIGMEKAVNSYQKSILNYKSTDGEITEKKKMWQSLLGMI